MKLHNPYKVGTQKYAMLEAFRANGYRLRKSWILQPDKIGLFIQSPSRRESDMKEDGFVIEVEDPRPEDGGSMNDHWHVMKHDPHNPAHVNSGVQAAKFGVKNAAKMGITAQEAVDNAKENLNTNPEKPLFGMGYCEKHKMRYKIGEACWRCAGERLKA